MMPTMHHGQFVLALRHFGRLRRGDIVLVRRGPEVLIKRVAYLPSETVKPIDVPLFQGVKDYFECGRLKGELVVPGDRIVVLGDNRLASDDSRRFGLVALRDVIGKVIAASAIP